MPAKENVIILGAGASADAGAPLMNNFIDVAEQLLRKKAFTDNDSISRIFELLADLQPMYAKSYLDLNNIETLFGVIEMARITGKLGSFSVEEIDSFRISLVRLIVETLEQSIHFDVDARGWLHPTQSYTALVRLLHRREIVNSTSLITFNYDLCMEVALTIPTRRGGSGVNINYCLNGQPSEGMDLLKLHGSVNWVLAKNGGQILPYYPASYLKQVHFEPTGLPAKGLVRIGHEISNNPKLFGQETYDLPVIVPPTRNKTEYHGSLAKVWKVAAQNLANAENIYVFGYSLPETDSFFRYLFATGTIGKARIKRFWVFDPDNSGSLEGRFRALLGPGILDRFKFFPLDFGRAIEHLEGYAPRFWAD